MNFIVSDRRS